MSVESRVGELLVDIRPVDADAAEAATRRHARLLKPPGSLGQLERLGIRLAAIAGTCPPPVPARPAVIVAAGDHGVHAQGVTMWPQRVTATMVEAFCAGKAAVNAIAAAVGAQVSVLDVGVVGDVSQHPALRRSWVRAGTADLSAGPALRREEAARALLAGAGLAEELVGAGADLLVTGDMGIANTTASACLVAAFTGRAPGEVTGPGAGADAATVERKTRLVAAALDRHRPHSGDPLGVLAAVGGLEHAALVGVILSGAADAVPVVLDGLCADAAALAATALCPAVVDYVVAGHRSTEPGAHAALRHLGLVATVDLGLHLGEGTGALLAVPILTAAARVLNDMGTLDEFGAVPDSRT